MPLKIARFVSVFLAALAFGITYAHVMELPGHRELSGGAWLAVQHTFYGGFAVTGAIAEIGGLLATHLDHISDRQGEDEGAIQLPHMLLWLEDFERAALWQGEQRIAGELRIGDWNPFLRQAQVHYVAKGGHGLFKLRGTGEDPVDAVGNLHEESSASELRHQR